MKISFENFSPHLFWDVEPSKIDFDKHKAWVIQRVLEYGLMNDWKLIHQYYGINEIAQTVMNLKDIDKKSASFISVLSGIPKEKFLCYSINPSKPKHWNF